MAAFLFSFRNPVQYHMLPLVDTSLQSPLIGISPSVFVFHEESTFLMSIGQRFCISVTQYDFVCFFMIRFKYAFWAEYHRSDVVPVTVPHIRGRMILCLITC